MILWLNHASQNARHLYWRCVTANYDRILKLLIWTSAISIVLITGLWYADILTGVRP